MRWFLLFLLLFFSTHGTSSPWDTWVFGDGARVDFTATPPAVTSFPSFYSLRNALAWRQTSGQLTLITNGMELWKHDGSVLFPQLPGNLSASQGLTLIPYSTSQAYLFILPDLASTLSAPADNGLRYINIDLTTLSNLNPSFTTLSMTPLTEKLAVARHCNQADYWLVFHERGNNRYHAQLIDSFGTFGNSSTSNTGATLHTSSAYSGQMKFSPNGLILAMTTGNGVDLLSFDNSSGALYPLPGHAPLSFSSKTVFGVEFSPNGQFLYITTTEGASNSSRTSRLYQYNLITQQLLDLGSFTSSTGNLYSFYALQRATNDKIYMARFQSGSLGVIHHPNLAGPQAQFDITQGLALHGSSLSTFGLPYNYSVTSSTEYCAPLDQQKQVLLTKEVKDNSIQLTASIQIPGFFVIEKSFDSLHWETLAEAASRDETEFKTFDATPFATTYYRAQFLENSGVRLTSPIVYVNFKNLRPVVFPNPFRGHLNINSGSTSPLLNVSLTNVTGEEVLQRNQLHPATKISTEHLSAGVYFLKFKQDQQAYSFRLLKY